jgi:hypothetical protein
MARTSHTLPRDYVPRYTDAEVNRRFYYLAERCVAFISTLTVRHPTWDLNVDLLLLKHVAVSAMDDIWRYKVYHLGTKDKRSDAVKRAAYFTKWLVKLRPIYFHRPTRAAAFSASFDKEDDTIFVNEAFAIHIACVTIATDANLPTLCLSPVFYAEVLYDLHFRNMNDDALLALFQTIKHVAVKTTLTSP